MFNLREIKKIMLGVKPKLSKEEQQMVSLIENFPFPNEREASLSALIFVKEYVNILFL